MNSEDTRKQVAYDLTMEYIHDCKTFNQCYNEIPQIVEKVNKIYNSFYEALEHKEIINR